MEPASEISSVVSWLIDAVLRDAEAALRKSADPDFQKELEALKKKMAQVEASLNTKSRNDFSLEPIRDLAYRVQDLLDEWDYGRIQGAVERGGNEVNPPSDDQSTEGVEVKSPFNEARSPSIDGGNSSASIGGDNKISRVPSSSSFRKLFRIGRSTSKKGGASPLHPSESACRSPVRPSDFASRMKGLVKSLQKACEDIGLASKSEASGSISLSNLEIEPKKLMQTMNPLVGEPPVFGMDQERDRLVSKLLTGSLVTDNNGTPSILSIVGFAGVGKTTLARLVYHDERVKTRFELQMWVTAGSNFDVSRVAREILQQVCGCDDSHVEAKRLAELLKEIRESLGSKRFLLVVDDMQEGYHDQSGWKLLLDPLKQSSSSVEGSMILVTTRVQSVSEGVSGLDTVHLYGLEDRDSWDLLKSLTFDDEWFDINPNLEIIGRQIARKLKGNPLSAKSISAFLKRDLDKAHWRGVLGELNLEGGDVANTVLKFSYEKLPSSLRQCFSYSALFPEDYPFNREDLVRLWIAQGFVISNGRRVEDVGHEYFDSLVDRCFLQRVDKENQTEYVVHDLLLALVSSQELLRLDGSGSGPIPSTVCHISVVRKDFEKELDECTKSLEGENLRSFIFMGKEGSIDPNVLENIPSRIKEAKGLRVLRLNGTPSFPTFLSNTGNFIHLRYLSLDSDFETLPKEICKLYHLQFLDVSHCTKLTSLPETFSNLVELRHFIADKKLHSMISNVRKLTSLQELSEFRVRTHGPFGIEQLGDLAELGGSLSIYDLTNVGSKEAASKAGLVEKKFINSLCLSWNGTGAGKEKEKGKGKGKGKEKETEIEIEIEIEIETETEKEIGIEKETETETEKEKETEVFESLQPHVNLKSLQILGYHGNNMPSWLTDTAKLANLVNIVSVYLENCSELEALPPLGELPFLKKLHLKSLRKVNEIGPQLYGNSENGLGFQSLEEILIENMEGLKSWHWSNKILLFPALQVLEIKNCLNLRGIPLTTPDSLETEEYKPFPCLNTLVINNCPKVEKISPLPHTHRLSRISIKGVGSFGELDLSVLRGELLVEISSNHGLKSLDELLLFYNLRSLTSLCIKDCPNLKTLGGEGIFALVCLNNLRIEECTKLDSLPSDLTQLLSLEKLSIVGCESVKSFPENDLPDSLKELNVDKCTAELREICKRIDSKGKIHVKFGGSEMI